MKIMKIMKLMKIEKLKKTWIHDYMFFSDFIYLFIA